MLFRYFGIFIPIFNLLNCHSEYSRAVYKKGLPPSMLEAKIVGGTEASIETYPFAVQFFNMGGMCGGVIINSWTIMTSAHCLAGNTNTDHMIVIAGSKYLYDFNANKHNVRACVAHENFSKEQPFACDVALLFLSNPLRFSNLIKKVIIVDHNKWTEENETKFVVTGWGWTKYGGEVSNSLMTAKLHYVNAEKCSKLHNNYPLTSDMFCLYGDGKRDSCRGDSGGGVLWNDMLVGLTSHGDGCANKDSPSMFTNVGLFRDWIKEKVKMFMREYCSEKETTDKS